jgi:hypothetical protein
MANIAGRDQLADIARPVADLVERFGFKWEFDYEYALPDTERRVQIRSEDHYAPAPKVAELRAVMKRGEKLPPIVVTQDGHIVDGNTRVTAARRNGFPTIQAIVLDVKAEGAKESENRRLWALGAAFNARHGKGIDREELRRAVGLIGSDPAYTATRIAALIGVTDSVVQSLLAEKRGRDRAEALGLQVNGSVGAGRLRVLGRASEGLNDEPFKDLFSLVQDSGLSAADIRQVVTRAKETKSDEGALGVLSQERQARRDQISEYRASGKAVPPNSAKLRQRLGFILNFEASPRDLVEHNPDLVREHADLIERTVLVLRAAAEAQGA